MISADVILCMQNLCPFTFTMHLTIFFQLFNGLLTLFLENMELPNEGEHGEIRGSVYGIALGIMNVLCLYSTKLVHTIGKLLAFIAGLTDFGF